MRRSLCATALAVAWWIVAPGAIRAQAISDTVWVGVDSGAAVPPIVIRLHPDSIGVVPVPGLDSAAVGALRDSLAARGATYVRGVPGGIFIFGYLPGMVPGGSAGRDSAFARVRRLRLDLQAFILQAGPTATSPSFGGEARVVTDEAVLRFPAGMPQPLDSMLLLSLGGRIVFRNPYVSNEVLVQALNGDGMALARRARLLSGMRRTNANLRTAATDAGSATTGYDPVHQWHLDHIRVKGAWAVVPTGSSTLVGVLEVGTPFELAHPDVAPQLSTLGAAWDFTGCQSSVVNSSTGAAQTCGQAVTAGSGYHSTAVAGLVAAAGNGVGVVGVCPTCNLLLLLERGSNSYAKELAVEYAADRGARVLNASFESRGEATGLAATINAVADKMTFVLAAGNSNRTCADWDLLTAKVVVVGAVDQQDQRTRLATGVPHGVSGPCLALVAPGWDLKTTVPGGGTGDLSGTSSAAPVVSGVAGLMWTAGPGLTGHDVREFLGMSAEQVTTATVTYTAGHNDDYGFGLVNACAAVRLAAGLPDWQQACRDDGSQCPPWLFVLVVVVVFLVVFFVWPGRSLEGRVRWLVSLALAALAVILVWLVCRFLV